jgi:hypothetical protein
MINQKRRKLNIVAQCCSNKQNDHLQSKVTECPHENVRLRKKLYYEQMNKTLQSCQTTDQVIVNVLLK